MWFRKIFQLFFVSFLINDFASAQQIPVKKDSTVLYKNIETYSKRNRVTQFMYSLVFKPAAIISKKKEAPKKVYKNLIQKPYSTFEGKIIRKIDVVTLDPFGYSVNDTASTSKNILYRSGNWMHIKTQGIAIRNLLLIRKNTPFNSLLVKESERLIRTQKYVHEVAFYVVSSAPKSDSVDIFIRERDKWSIIPEGSISEQGLSFGITDKNIGGTGHEFRNAYSRDFKKGISSFFTNYTIPNIRNTYIRTILNYEVDGYRNFNRSLSVERPFFSPYAKWAAGISLASLSDRDTLKYINSVYAPSKVKFKAQDFWAGKAFQMFRGNSEDERATNLILAIRYLRVRYSEKPAEIYDPLHIYSNEDFYFASIGVSTRKYVQDKFVFNYGITEDVPIGRIFGLTGGFQLKNNIRRLYMGMQLSFGNYYPWGYLSPNIEYGTFFRSSNAEQGVITAGVNYFSGLIEVGKWKFRQFVKPQVTIGINRFSYDSLTLNEGYGLDGFHSPDLSGTNRLLFTLQTQSYSPWNVAGFRFGPYITYTLGMLGDAETGFKTSKIYSQLGLGVLIKNHNLVFNSFQISVSFYPLVPGVGQDVFKMNSFRTSDFGFRDFETGKPSKVVYR